MAQDARPLAVITGASSGIGYELAHLCAKNGYDLVIAADRGEIHHAAQHFRSHGVRVEAIEADLATTAGVDKLYGALDGAPVDVLCANAGQGLGHAFLDQDFAQVKKVVDTNITGTIYLLQRIGRDMRGRGAGRILITGSIAGFMPGSFQAVYNGTKAFIDSFAFALRDELRDSGVTVTCLMPGVTDTNFFKRGGLTDTPVGQGSKDDPADVAEVGFNAMMRGDGDVVSGWKNKVQTSLAAITPSGMLARQHRKMAEPIHEAQQRRQREDDQDHGGLWSIMLPAGLAVAAGVALMSRARQTQSGEHRTGARDYSARSGLGAQRRAADRGEDFGSPSRSPSYPDGERARSRARTMEAAQADAGRHSTAVERMPFETSNTGRQTVGDAGAFRNADASQPRGLTRVTE